MIDLQAIAKKILDEARQLKANSEATINYCSGVNDGIKKLLDEVTAAAKEEQNEGQAAKSESAKE